jgi:phage FluMu protein Com
MDLIELRCFGCGRLLAKYAVGTVGTIQIKCWATRCRQLNTVKIESYKEVSDGSFVR